LAINLSTMPRKSNFGEKEEKGSDLHGHRLRRREEELFLLLQRAERCCPHPPESTLVLKRGKGGRSTKMEAVPPPKPAQTILGPVVKGKPRLISVDFPKMSEREMERYNRLLEEMEALQVTAAGRVAGTAPHTLVGNLNSVKGPLITGGRW